VSLLLLLLSALISGSEVAFFSLQAKDLEEIEEKGTKRAQIVSELKHNPKQLLSTLLVANNTVNVGIIIITSYTLSNYFHLQNEKLQFLVEVVFITSILLLLGEIVPKVYATNNKKKLSYFMAKPIYYLGKIPPVSWMNAILISSTQLIENKLTNNQDEISAEEFNQAIDLTIKDDDDLADERKILKG
jgi:Mg2+/Co2+ transporter CorB